MFTTVGRDQLLDQMDGLFAGLATAVAGLRAGSVTEANYTGYNAGARPGITFGAQADTSPAGARQVANSAAVAFPQNTGSNQDVIALTIHTATSGGSIRKIQYLSPIAPFVATAEASAENFAARSHGMSANQRVRLIAAAGAVLPTGVSEDTDYYVMSTGLSTDAFRLSTAPSDSGPVNITAFGACQVMPITPVTIAGGATPEFAIGAIVARL